MVGLVFVIAAEPKEPSCEMGQAYLLFSSFFLYNSCLSIAFHYFNACAECAPILLSIIRDSHAVAVDVHPQRSGIKTSQKAHRGTDYAQEYYSARQASP